MKTITREAVEWLTSRLAELETEAVELRSELRKAQVARAAGQWIDSAVYGGHTKRELDDLTLKIDTSQVLLEELLKRVTP